MSFFSRFRYALGLGIGAGLLLGNVAYVIAADRGESYEADVRLVIAPSPSLEDPSAAIYAEDVLSRQTVTATLAEILSSGRLHRESAEEIGMAATDATAYSFDASAAPQANVVTVTVTGPDPATVASLANALGANGVEYFTRLYGLYQVATVDDAEVPGAPVGLPPWQLALIAATAGVVVGGLIGSRIDDARRGSARGGRHPISAVG